MGLLLQTIVFEEQALAALINAEAEKIQELAKAGLSGPISASEATELNQSVAEVIKLAGEKEERLLRKLHLVLSSRPGGSHCHEDGHDRKLQTTGTRV
jgi:hypothetical protein